MARPTVTVAVVPRERFSFAQRSLTSILERTEGDYELLYVDGNSPPEAREFIERMADDRKARHVAVREGIDGGSRWDRVGVVAVQGEVAVTGNQSYRCATAAARGQR